jgi:hypothetical protein
LIVRNAILQITLNLLSEKSREWSSEIYFYKSLPGDSDTHESLRATSLLDSDGVEMDVGKGGRIRSKKIGKASEYSCESKHQHKRPG